MALTDRFIDYSGGSDANGGTSDGDAWKTLAHAYSTITNANAWRLNLKSNADHVLTATLTPSYNPGWGSEDTAIHHVGYTSTQGDGGRATIDCGGFQYINQSAYDNLHFYGLKFKNWGSGDCIRLDDCNTLYGCEFDGEGSRFEFFQMDNYNIVANCWFHSLDNSSSTIRYPCYLTTSNEFWGNRVEVNQRQYGVRVYWGSIVRDNLFLNNGSTSTGTAGMIVVINGDNATISNNIIYSTASGNNYQSGIYLGWGSTGNLRIMNNYIEGMRYGINASGSGLQSNLWGGNVAYNNWTADFSYGGSTEIAHRINADVSLTRSGLMDASNGDYRPNALLRELGVGPQWGDNYADNQDGLFSRSVGWPDPRQRFRENFQALEAGIAY